LPCGSLWRLPKPHGWRCFLAGCGVCMGYPRVMCAVALPCPNRRAAVAGWRLACSPQNPHLRARGLWDAARLRTEESQPPRQRTLGRGSAADGRIPTSAPADFGTRLGCGRKNPHLRASGCKLPRPQKLLFGGAESPSPRQCGEDKQSRSGYIYMGRGGYICPRYVDMSALLGVWRHSAQGCSLCSNRFFYSRASSFL